VRYGIFLHFSANPHLGSQISCKSTSTLQKTATNRPLRHFEFGVNGCLIYVSVFTALRFLVLPFLPLPFLPVAFLTVAFFTSCLIYLFRFYCGRFYRGCFYRFRFYCESKKLAPTSVLAHFCPCPVPALASWVLAHFCPHHIHFGPKIGIRSGLVPKWGVTA